MMYILALLGVFWFFGFFFIFPGTYSLALLTHTTGIIYSVSEQLFLDNNLHKDKQFALFIGCLPHVAEGTGTPECW